MIMIQMEKAATRRWPKTDGAFPILLLDQLRVLLFGQAKTTSEAPDTIIEQIFVTSISPFFLLGFMYAFGAPGAKAIPPIFVAMKFRPFFNFATTRTLFFVCAIVFGMPMVQQHRRAIFSCSPIVHRTHAASYGSFFALSFSRQVYNT